MGRRDAVQVVLEVVSRMRQLLPGLVVSYEPGWETRGNGTSANYEGGIVHHTASASSLSRPFPTQTILRAGRTGLPGPLCNFAGPACTLDAPRLHVMAANPANHAGASGGKAMGPLPITSLFNPRVLGLEVDYAGTVAMLPGQLLVAHAWARAVADVVGGGDLNRIRAHAETSITGKWDIGVGPGKTANMADFRRSAALMNGEDMPSAEEIARAVWTFGIAEANGIGPAPAFAWLQHAAIMATGAAGNLKQRIGYAVKDATGDAQEADAVIAEMYGNIRTLIAREPQAATGPVTIDPGAVSIDYEKLANAIVARQDAVARDGDPTTGPTT